MEYRRLGSSGLKVSAISLGAWITYGSSGVEDNAAVACIHRAIELGINFIDVADIYERGAAETVVGQAIASHKRSDLVISTKAFWPMSDNVNDRGLSRKHIIESVNQSLKRLNTEYVDIFFCHRFDPEVPVEESLRAIDDLITQGKVLYWGTSMWTAANLDEAFAVLKQLPFDRPVVEQPLYNMLDRDGVEGDLERAMKRHEMSLVVWSPLAQGVLTGKYNHGIPEDSRAKASNIDQAEFAAQMSPERIDKARALTSLAQEMGTTSAALAIAWTLKNPVVASAITGATRISQVDENVRALDVTITPDIDLRIEQILRGVTA